jgi:hypothetical protein
MKAVVTANVATIPLLTRAKSDREKIELAKQRQLHGLDMAALFYFDAISARSI